MQIGTKFSVSIHILLLAVLEGPARRVTSDFIASSVNTNPVVIRKLMGMLRDGGIIRIAKGTGGIELTRDPSDITFLDIYRAVEPQAELMKIHSNPEPLCRVGRNIDALLTPRFERIQSSFYGELARENLADLLKSLEEKLT